MFCQNSLNARTNQSASPQSDSDYRWGALKQDLHRRLIQAVDHTALRNMDEAQIRHQLRLGAEELCRVQPDLLSPNERKRLLDELVDETLGFGPLEPLLNDESVSDILINGPRMIYVERNGRLEATSISFHSEQHLLATVQKIVNGVGRRIDESSPMVDARLPDGSRVNAIISPLALDGPLVSIRRSRSKAVTAQQMLATDALTPKMLSFLKSCVESRANIVISGGTGSGKTTLLNMLSAYIPPNERVVTIEDAAELRLQQPHVARLESRPPNLEGTGEITTRDLLRNALRMRPDRIIVGECRGGEALDMLQAMNTGHSGSLTTVHANSTRDAIYRLEMLVELSGCDLSPVHIAKQIAAAVNILVQVTRLPDGRRKVVQISKLKGIHGNEIQLQDVFRFEQAGIDADGRVCGRFLSATDEPSQSNRSRSDRQSPERPSRGDAITQAAPGGMREGSGQ